MNIDLRADLHGHAADYLCVPFIADVRSVIVRQLAPGVRVRGPVGGQQGGCRHQETVAKLPPGWARLISGGQP